MQPSPDCTGVGGTVTAPAVATAARVHERRRRAPRGGRAAEDKRAEPGAGARARAHAPARRRPEEPSGPAAAAGARRRAAAGRARAVGWSPRRARPSLQPRRWSCRSPSCSSRTRRPPARNTWTSRRRAPPAEAGAGRVEEPGCAARIRSRVSAGGVGLVLGAPA